MDHFHFSLESQDEAPRHSIEHRRWKRQTQGIQSLKEIRSGPHIIEVQLPWGWNIGERY